MKSLKVRIRMAARSTMIEAAMLNVNSASRAAGGRGTSIIARTARTMAGATAWDENPGNWSDLSESFI